MDLPTVWIDIPIRSYLLCSPALSSKKKSFAQKRTFRPLQSYHVFVLFNKNFFTEYLLHPEAVPGCGEVGEQTSSLSL